jgi:CRISPR-associated protein Cas2
MLTVITYDVSNDKRRLKIAKLLGAFGDRVQYSVFEAHLDPRDLKRLRARIRKVIEPFEDSVRFYKISSPDDSVEIEGMGVMTEKLGLIVL